MRPRHGRVVPPNRQDLFEPLPQSDNGHPPASEIDPDADALNEVVMSLDMRDRGTVGCCYYIARHEKLYFMEDVRLGGVDVVDARKFTLH